MFAQLILHGSPRQARDLGSREESAVTGDVYFEALITPHRSLSRQGLRRLVALLLGLSALTAFRFWLIGAWPVIAFTGVEILLTVLLLRLNAARGRASELVLLTHAGARVIRTDWRGRREESSVEFAWLRVALEDTPGGVPRLVLRARDSKLVIGAFLAESEKRELADALRMAMRGMREPRFDNPQLQH